MKRDSDTERERERGMVEWGEDILIRFKKKMFIRKSNI